MIGAFTLAAALAAAPPAASPGEARRVVSLVPSLTDIVLALGEGTRLVGVSRFDDDPRLAGLPRVGGYLDPNVEAVVGLRPDLVLAYDGAEESRTVSALRQAGLRVLALHADALPEVEASAARVADALGDAAAGARLRRSMEATLDRVRAAARGQPVERMAVVVGWRPLVLAGRSSYLEPLLEAVGATNVVGGDLAWPTYSVEALVAQAPAVVVDGAPEEGAAASGGVLAVLRERGTRVLRLPDGDLFRPGPRALHGLEELARALRGP
ncbi:MAG TPA: helical backbone metal receptor [Myxococcales bacterium]|nr:helical backbone metal receptor [Myxococcales bacterium]